MCIRDSLSTAALMGLTLWMVALGAGLRWRSLLGTALAGSLLGTASILINEYQRIRVVSFLDPWNDPMGDGYQLVQSLLAIGSGGWMGQGYGLSTQKLQYLPIQSTDFIYAVFAEEFGFVGSVLLLLFLMLVATSIRNSSSSTCLLYTSPSPRDATLSRMPSSA